MSLPRILVASALVLLPGPIEEGMAEAWASTRAPPWAIGREGGSG